MLSHLLTQLLRSFGIFFRTIRAFFTRRLVGLWARLKRLTNFSRQATKVAADSLQSAAAIAKKPTSRGDYVETGRLFISKKFLLTLAVGVIVLALLAYFVAWPFLLSHFFTAHFYVGDNRIENWTGRVVVYTDAEKTLPLYEGRLENGLLQGQGRVQVDYWMLEAPDGLCVKECSMQSSQLGDIGGHHLGVRYTVFVLNRAHREMIYRSVREFVDAGGLIA